MRDKKAYQKKYYEANREKLIAYSAARSKTNEAKASRAAFYKANREKMLVANRIYRAANPETREERKAREQRYYSAHPEKAKVMRAASVRRAKQWASENLDRKRLFSAKQGAKKRHIAWSLPEALALDLITDSCFYCGTQAHPVNGIDRVDNAKGYEYGNVVSSCKRCNEWKRAANVDDFLGHVRSIAVRHSVKLPDAKV